MENLTKGEKGEIESEIFPLIKDHNGLLFEEANTSSIEKKGILKKVLCCYYWEGCVGCTEQEEILFGKNRKGEWEEISVERNCSNEHANGHIEGTYETDAKSVGEQIKGRKNEYTRLCLVSTDFRGWAEVNDISICLEDNLSKKGRKEILEKEEKEEKVRKERATEIEKDILQTIGDIKKHNFLAKQSVEGYEEKHRLVEKLLVLECENLHSMGGLVRGEIGITLIEARDSYYDLYEINLIKDDETFGICHIPKEIADSWENSEWILPREGFVKKKSRDSYEEYRQKVKELSEKYEADNSYDEKENEEEDDEINDLRI